MRAPPQWLKHTLSTSVLTLLSAACLDGNSFSVKLRIHTKHLYLPYKPAIIIPPPTFYNIYMSLRTLPILSLVQKPCSDRLLSVHARCLYINTSTRLISWGGAPGCSDQYTFNLSTHFLYVFLRHCILLPISCAVSVKKIGHS